MEDNSMYAVIGSVAVAIITGAWGWAQTRHSNKKDQTMKDREIISQDTKLLIDWMKDEITDLKKEVGIWRERSLSNEDRSRALELEVRKWQQEVRVWQEKATYWEAESVNVKRQLHRLITKFRQMAKGDLDVDTLEEELDEIESGIPNLTE
jgi:hypothetical protein